MKFNIPLMAMIGVAVLAPTSGRAILADTEIVVEAFVDGHSTFHLTPQGVYWTAGTAAKPGRWHRNDYPTYINGVAWKPVWGKSGETGPDKSEVYPLAFGTVEVNYHLNAVTQERGGTGREKRTPIKAKREGAEFTVLIPDLESEPRWYRFTLNKR